VDQEGVENLEKEERYHATFATRLVTLSGTAPEGINRFRVEEELMVGELLFATSVRDRDI
jgi:hypothetical protein